eukprot:TRINITY_DN52068_c0_g1_i1.p1 TRINITY_DN52068_c0_g1~~TRINITY_DN52068_c0_g1_i1.p1  ORF type:complete len:128 (+),score=17.35 TRINITY_DN52068_c0_g1_i1:31-384(+)
MQVVHNLIAMSGASVNNSKTSSRGRLEEAGPSVGETAAVASTQEIDSEDDAWDGTISPITFEQDREAQKRAQIIARLEAQNRPAAAAAKSKANPQAPLAAVRGSPCTGGYPDRKPSL